MAFRTNPRQLSGIRQQSKMSIMMPMAQPTSVSHSDSSRHDNRRNPSNKQHAQLGEMQDSVIKQLKAASATAQLETNLADTEQPDQLRLARNPTRPEPFTEILVGADGAMCHPDNCTAIGGEQFDAVSAESQMKGIIHSSTMVSSQESSASAGFTSTPDIGQRIWREAAAACASIEHRVGDGNKSVFARTTSVDVETVDFAKQLRRALKRLMRAIRICSG